MTILEISRTISLRSAILAEPELTVTELLFDSRRLLVPEQTLFFAVRTEKANGHDFIPALIKAGVRNFVVTESPEKELSNGKCNFLVVENSIRALQQLVQAHRRQFHIPVIGITGSNGKTIVKEWLTQMLADEFTLVANPNSYNSQIGVPMSVWQMKSTDELGIFEAGISQPDEMENLEQIIRPTIGIITNIGSAHSQFFANDTAKLKEKLKLFTHCEKIIYCADHPLIDKEINSTFPDKTLLSWGKGDNAHVPYTKKSIVEGKTVVTINQDDFIIPFHDTASVENALHTIILMLSMNFSAEKINHKLARLKSVAMRMEVMQAENDSIIINDTYSLDFNSLQVALDFLKSQIRYSHKVVILSDFEQVRTFDDRQYQFLHQMLASNGVSKLLAVGPDFYRHRHHFPHIECHFYPTTSDLLAALSSMTFRNEAILVKGARSFCFEKVTEALQLRSHKTILSVSLPALVSNLKYYRSLLSPETKVVAMVKAMCYGLGDVELINELQYHRIDYLAVAYTDEGVNLRKKNVKLPIIVLGAEGESFEMMIHYQLEPEIFNFYSLTEFEKALSNHPEIQSFNIHLKIDSGMHRLGFRKEEVAELAQRIAQNPQLHVSSVFSHLAAAEDPSQDEFTRAQISYFQEATESLCHHFNYPILRHIDNTAGISRFPEAHFDMVRLGIGLYGFSAVEADRPHLQHVATLKTVITHVERLQAGDTVGYNRGFTANAPMTIGIIPLGYADGFPPELGNGVGNVIVRGKRAPIIGKICMDMTMIDLTGLEDVQEGEEVIIYGEENRMDDIALKIGKIPYHLLTSISKRVQRIYILD